jgi:hypothetical protein
MYKKILFIVYLSLLAASYKTFTTHDLNNDTWINNEIIAIQPDQNTAEPEHTTATSQHTTTATGTVLENTDDIILYC